MITNSITDVTISVVHATQCRRLAERSMEESLVWSASVNSKTKFASKPIRARRVKHLNNARNVAKLLMLMSEESLNLSTNVERFTARLALTLYLQTTNAT